MTKANLKGLTLAELEEFSLSIGEQRYRGKQLFDWIYTKAAPSFHDMTPLSGSLREKLAGIASIDSLELVEEQKSQADGTTKFLFRLADGKKIESVLIPPRTAFRGTEATGEEEQKRLTLCGSTQGGCPPDCPFWATATMGFHRNLSAGESVDHALQAPKDPADGRRGTKSQTCDFSPHAR